MKGWGCAIIAAAVAAGCGGDAEPLRPGIPAVKGDQGSNWQGGAAAGPSEVRIAILAPADGTLLRAATAPEVRAQVRSIDPTSDQPAADGIDPTTVVYTLRGAAAREPVLMGPLFGPMADAQWSSRMDLARVDTGDYVLAVSASTTGRRSAVASVMVRVDAGPRIRVLSPVEGKSYKGSAVVQVTVDATPFDPPMNVEATVAGRPIPLTAAGATNGWEGLIEFAKFDPPLDQDQMLRVSASNAQGTRTEAQVRFLIDNKGPVFVATEPKEGSVVGGVIRVRAKLQDVAGVIGPSVIAVIGNRADVNFKVELKPESEAGVYSALFDTRRLTTCGVRDGGQNLCVVFPNLSFRAADALGNEAIHAYDFSIDNHPPYIDLQPPLVRVRKFEKKLNRHVCSHSFEPLGRSRMASSVSGGDMPRDLCEVPQVFDLRALIEDMGNHAEGLKSSPVSGVDATTTAMYVLRDATQPLVVDSDNDGVCDIINPKLIPTTSPPTEPNEVLKIRLLGVPPAGNANFTPNTGYPATSVCSDGIDDEAPPPLCVTQSIPMAIGTPTVRGPDPAVWGLEAITQPGGQWCLGSQFDTHANRTTNNKWACIAAAAVDRAGNTGVSQALRVWVNQRPVSDPMNLPPPVCPARASRGAAPDCTGSYDRATGMVTTKPCRMFGQIGAGTAYVIRDQGG